MFDTNMVIVTESDIQAQKREWQVASVPADPATPTLIVRYVTIDVTGADGTENESNPWTLADGPARTFCDGWQAYQLYGTKLPGKKKFAFATLEAQVGWEEAHGMATKVTIPRWATDFNSGWDAFRMAQPVGATIRSNEALRGWQAAREDHLAWDVDRYEVTL